ncbi:hypothetical protein [Elizabethkingia anophelis]|uniref:hypothetical protein n=1 Tax=Elizabethkingia anophelis TaxID=1117645 RepID=UPI00075199A1|nr:hypothetical protein [Elizabethkingia anophelis]AQW91279.1 hypothetical protein BBD28_11715 [Elizabethkingia anophelis]KUY14145.1 hypothetical protein ATB94_09095 [Elizabethkingia anophelis]
MKKIISIFLLTISLILSAQKSDLYSSYKLYDYGSIENAEIIKLKTERYLRNLIRGGYIIKKKEVTQTKIDIDFIVPDEKGASYLKANLVYEFDNDGYSASMYFPELYLKEKKKWIDLKDSVSYMKKIINILEDITYKDYQTEINSNF